MTKGKGANAKKTVTKRGKFHDWISDEGLTLIEGWARDGLTDAEIMGRMGIGSSTYYTWQKRFPEIRDALKKGKEVIDMEVEQALLKRAMGYDYVEVTDSVDTMPNGDQIKRTTRHHKHMAGNTTAGIFWLKNRQPEKWRDRSETVITGGVDINTTSEAIDTYLDEADIDLSDDGLGVSAKDDAK